MCCKIRDRQMCVPQCIDILKGIAYGLVIDDFIFVGTM